MLRLHDAILKLIDAKLDNEAAMLSRPLFEACVTAAWLFDKEEERIPLFHGSAIHTMKRANSLLRRWPGEFPGGAVPPIVEEVAKQLAEAEQVVRNRYGRKKPGSWGPFSVKEMAADRYMERWYDFVFGFLSDLEHSGPGGMIH